MGDPTDQSWDPETRGRKSIELFRFILAMAIILGFLLILGIAMVGSYADVPTLAGIFSSWIVAIIAFYFMEQASDRAAQQQSTLLLNDVKRVANETVERAEEETESLKVAMAEVVRSYEDQLSESRRIIQGYVDACSPKTDSPQDEG